MVEDIRAMKDRHLMEIRILQDNCIHGRYGAIYNSHQWPTVDCLSCGKSFKLGVGDPQLADLTKEYNNKKKAAEKARNERIKKMFGKGE